MALYEYRCRTCDDHFELRRPMSEADEPVACPQGHPDAVRLLSVFAAVGASSTGTSAARAASALTGPCGHACACFPN